MKIFDRNLFAIFAAGQFIKIIFFYPKHCIMW